MPVNPKSLENLIPFEKGKPDPRRNVKGVPKDIIELRHLAKNVLAEQLEMPATAGRKAQRVRRLVAMLRRMTSTNNPAAWRDVIKLAYPGALVDEVDVKSDGKALAPETMTPTQIAERVTALLAAKKPDES
jgi:hypothetical protein